MTEPFQFGLPGVNQASANRCCGKPIGCTVDEGPSGAGCVHRDHPWKVARRERIAQEVEKGDGYGV